MLCPFYVSIQVVHANCYPAASQHPSCLMENSSTTSEIPAAPMFTTKFILPTISLITSFQPGLFSVHSTQLYLQAL